MNPWVSCKFINLVTHSHSGRESAVKCVGGISDFFRFISGIRKGCVLAASLYNTWMN